MSPGAGIATVSFSAPLSIGGSSIVTYLVKTSVDGGATWQTAASVPTPQTVVLDGLIGGQSYKVEVIAVNAVGAGPAVVSSAFIVTSIPSAPLSVSVSNGDGQAVVSWQTPLFDGGTPISAYEVYESSDGGATFSLVDTVSPTTFSSTITGLVDGQTYWLKVVAVNFVGDGAPSSLVVANPIPALAAPTALTATPGDSVATLDWVAPVLTTTLPISGYVISVCGDAVATCAAGGTWTTALSTTPKPVTTSMVTGLANGTTYSFTVAVVVNGNIGPASAITTVTPTSVPSAPISVTATAGNAQIALSWLAPLSSGGRPVTSYDVQLSADGGGSWSTAAGASGQLNQVNALSATITGFVNGTTVSLSNGRTYLVRVNASNATGTGAWSVPVPVTPAILPGAPTALVGTGGPSSVLLAWTAPADTGGYPISDWTITWNESGGSNQSGSLTTTSAAPTASIPNLENYPYTITVAANTQAGTGPSSSVIATPAAPAPISPTGTPGDTFIILNWTTPTTYQGSTFKVETSNDGGVTWATPSTPVASSSNGGSTWVAASGAILPSNATSAKLSSLTNGVPVLARVLTVTPGGAQSLPSGVVVVTPAGPPLSPTALTVVAGDGQVVVNWNASDPNGSPVSSYVVTTSTNGTTWTTATTTALTSAVLVGLTNGQTYQIRVVAMNAADGGSASSAPATILGTPLTTPSVPQNVNAAPTAGGTGAVVTWTAPASTGGTGVVVTGYEIQYSADGGLTWSIPSSVATTSTTLTGLTAGLTYLVRVQAINSLGLGPWSVPVSVIPSGPASAPSAVTAQPSDSTVLLDWTAPTTNGGTPITAYQIEMCLGAPNSCATWLTVVVSTLTPVTTWAVQGLTNGTLYSFRVSALTSAGAGAPSSVVAATPSAVPGAPANLQATPGDSQVALTWAAAPENGAAIDSYFLSMTSDGGRTWSITTVVGTSYTMTGLSNGLTYAFRVAAHNAQGIGIASNLVTTTPWTTPSAPTAPSVTPADSGAVLTWSAPSSNGGAAVSGYVIEQLDPVNGWQVIAQTVGASTSYTIAGLVNGLSYSFRVSAKNAAGTGSPTQTLAVSPAGLPAAPSTISLTPGNATITLGWVPPTNTGGVPLTGYVIDVSTDGGLTWGYQMTYACPNSGACNAYTIHSLTGGVALINGHTYVVRIAASNAAGNSPWSAAASVVPAGPPAAPVSLVATGIDPGATLSWAAPTDTGGAQILGYIVSWKVHGSSAQPSSISTPTVSTNYTVNGLLANVVYDFMVAAVTSAGVGAASIPVTAIPFDVPTAPLTPTATAQSGAVSLSWAVPTSDEGSAITGYLVTQSIDGATWTTVATIANPTTRTTTVTGLVNGTTYSFRISAVNAAGGGAPSLVVAATPAAVPSAPGTPVVTTTNASLQVSWAAPVNNGGSPVTTYLIYLSSNNGVTFTQAATSPITNVTLNGLTAGVRYSVYVKAVNAAGTSVASATVQATAATTSVTSAPQNLAGTPGNAQAILSWTAPASVNNSAVIGYKILKSSDGGLTWTTAMTVGANTLGTTITGLSNGSTYSFEVVATNAIGDSAGSNVTAVTPVGPPAAPTGVVLTAGPGNLLVAWNAVSNPVGGAVTGYRVEISANVGSTWTTVVASTTSTVVTVPSLLAGTTYQVRVTTLSTAGNSVPSTIVSGVPMAVPGAVPTFAGTPRNGSASLTWSTSSAIAGSAVTNYVVSMCSASCGSLAAIWTVVATVAPPSPLAATVTGLTNGTSYVFSIVANNAIGSSPATTTTVVPAGPSSAPQMGTVTAGAGTLAVSWTAPATTNGTPVTGYTVQILDPTTGNWTTAQGASGALSGVNVSPATITGTGPSAPLVAGVTYSVRVLANSAVGQSAPSLDTTGTPLSAAGAPTMLTATAGDHQVVLNWVAPSADGGSPVTGYRIYAMNGSNATQVVANTGSTSTSYTLTGLTDGTAVTYAVAALNATGPSARSNTATATPASVPGAPSHVTATTNVTTATLNWTASSANGSPVSSYEVRISTDGGASFQTAMGANGLLTAVTGTTATVTGLLPQSTYLFVIAATNGVGTGSPCAPVSVTVAVLLTAPTSLRAVAGDTAVGLSWTAPVEPATVTLTGYAVEESTDGSTWTTLTSSTNSTQTSYVVSGLVDGTLYSFRVASVTTAGTSSFTTGVSATPIGLPGPPTGLTAAASGSGVALTWTAPVSTGGAQISSYRVQSSTNGSTWTTVVITTAIPATTIKLTTTAPTTYFRVAAANIAGIGTWSASATYTVVSPSLSTPTNLSINSSGSSATLTWTKAPTSTSTRIEQSIDGGQTWVTAVTSTGSTATVTSLTLGVTYQFRAVAVAGSLVSAPSSAVTLRLAAPPSVPQQVIVSGRTQSVQISWVAPANSNGAGVTGYVIQLATPGHAFVTVASPVATALQAVLTGLTTGTTYLVRIAAVNSSGTGVFSAAFTVVVK